MMTIIDLIQPGKWRLLTILSYAVVAVPLILAVSVEQ
jgi:hypothetical protein